jgi:hypothetical protein
MIIRATNWRNPLYIFFFILSSSINAQEQKNIILGNVVDTAVKFEFDTIRVLEISPAELSGRIFKEIFSFYNVVVEPTLDLSFSRFYKGLNLESTDFCKKVSFYFSEFREPVVLLENKFNDTTILSALTFDKDLHLSNCKFCKPVGFEYADFKGIADFTRNQFKDSVNFVRAKVEHNLYFNDTKFSNYINLSNLRFRNNSNIYFANTVLPDTIDFSFNDSLLQSVDFTIANFATKKNTKHLISLFKSNIEKIHIDYNHFRLYFPDTLFDDIRNKRVYFSNDDKQTIYERMLKNFKDNGQNESYKLLDIEFKRYKWKNSWASFLPCLPYYWNHFGYDKQLVFAWTLYFMVLFTLVNFFIMPYLNDKVYKVSIIPPLYEMENKLYRLWYSFVYTSIIFFKLTLKIEGVNFRNILGSMYILLMYLSGIICLAYIASFILNR